jgi:uroporphyrinogen-III decarboxylase
MLLVENGTAALTKACGCEVSYLAGSAPVIEKTPSRGSFWSQALGNRTPGIHPCARAVLDATRIVLDQIGNQAFVMGRADQGPFDLACMIAGAETLLEEWQQATTMSRFFNCLSIS